MPSQRFKGLTVLKGLEGFKGLDGLERLEGFKGLRGEVPVGCMQGEVWRF